MGLLQKCLHRLTDLDYLRHASWYYPEKLRVTKCLARLRRYHSGVRQDFLGERNQRLLQILRYAYQFCPYYTALLHHSGVRDGNLRCFDAVPLLTKELIRQHREHIVSSQSPSLLRWGTRITGGSTGDPLEFLASVNFDTEHQLFLYRMMGYRKGDRILAMDGSSIDADCVANGIYWKKKSDHDLPYGSRALSSLYLNEGTVRSYAEYLHEFQPAIIRGYPAFINEVAVYLKSNGLRPRRKLHGIVLTSETVRQSQIDTVAEAFETSVFLQYGHSEASLFGYTVDDTFEYHCSPFYGYVEVLDESGRQVRPGEIGEVVCTGFYNFAMPFIRYRTGDLAEFSGDSDGIVRLKRVVGRVQDYLCGADGTRVLLTGLLGQHCQAFSHIKRWQIVQDEPGRVQVLIVREEGFGPEDERDLKENFRKLAGIAAELRYVESVPLTGRGKTRLLVQHVGTAMERSAQ